MSEEIVKTYSAADMKARALETAENIRANCHATYNGGHHEENMYEAFHHGMDTICNVLGNGQALAAFAAKEVDLATAKLVCSSCEAFKLHRLPTRDMLRERAEKAEQALFRATEAERLENAQAVCIRCQRSEYWDKAKKRGDKWLHSYSNCNGVAECLAAPIWERAHGKEPKA